MAAHLPALSYKGSSIHERGEMLSLTDMWKAAGSPSEKRPDDWKKDSANRAFLDHVAMVANAPVEGIWKGRRGMGGGTWAHWQIALPYAKYLDHDFHMWCNEAVRARMEGRAPAAPATRPPRRTSASELRLSHEYWHRISLAAGLDPNQALISTNRLLRKVTGVDVMAEMGITALAAPSDDVLLIPTQIGQRLGGLGPRPVNKALIAGEYQTSYTYKGDLLYELTEKGKEAGGRCLDTERRHSDGTLVKQIKWPASIVDALRAEGLL